MDQVEYKVVVNHEMQYSIWPTWKLDPPGWSDEGTVGNKDECLDHIGQIWTDMRPLSLQKFMDDHGIDPNRKIEIPDLGEDDGVDHFHKAQPPNELVQLLLEPQPVQIIRYLNDDKTPNNDKLLRAAELGYVLVKFTNTTGGTEIGANLKNDDPQCGYEVNDNSITFRYYS
eukprot:TRINITY_DN2178_c0_g1_i4.p1 TRINITY_DN2178_c0_g1~~TRINITY_DN2178_c0_g1_i4.p1  ORF type:complete len:171 (-),score=56.85 TRINITY_DN2178_c0_g1_i4:65-577(-)